MSSPSWRRTIRHGIVVGQTAGDETNNAEEAYETIQRRRRETHAAGPEGVAVAPTLSPRRDWTPSGRRTTACTNDRCQEAFAELIEIYHAQNAEAPVRPPLDPTFDDTPRR